MSAARKDSGPIALLAEIFEGAPRLPGAACVGRPELFDPAAPGEDAETAAARHTQARRLCAMCPQLRACGDWRDGDSGAAMMVSAALAPPPTPGRPPRTEPAA